MAVAPEELQNILLKTFPNAKIEITDLVGDQDHYLLQISDQVFSGLPLIKQHKLVKTALKDILESKLHAITIKTIAL